MDRDAIARYGLDGQTVLSLVETGLGGKTSGSILQGQRRFDISLRLNPSARDAVDRIGDLWVDTPTGQRIPLKNLASITLEEGAARIGRDKNSRRIAIKCGVARPRHGRLRGRGPPQGRRAGAAARRLPHHLGGAVREPGAGQRPAAGHRPPVAAAAC